MSMTVFHQTGYIWLNTQTCIHIIDDHIKFSINFGNNVPYFKNNPCAKLECMKIIKNCGQRNVRAFMIKATIFEF